MRRFALASFVGFFALSVYGIPNASAAGYTNASLTGSFACFGSGYAQMKNAKGVSTWVPFNQVIQFTGDGSGAFTGSGTTNVAGLVCSGTFKGTGTTNPDGTGSATANNTPAASNPPQCPPAGAVHNVSVITSPSSLYLIGTDPNGTGWAICTKQTQ